MLIDLVQAHNSYYVDNELYRGVPGKHPLLDIILSAHALYFMGSISGFHPEKIFWGRSGRGSFTHRDPSPNIN